LVRLTDGQLYTLPERELRSILGGHAHREDVAPFRSNRDVLIANPSDNDAFKQRTLAHHG
jgi:hypothetical protein